MSFELESIDDVQKLIEHCKKSGVICFEGFGLKITFYKDATQRKFEYDDLDEASEASEDSEKEMPLVAVDDSERFDKDYLINNPPNMLY